MRLIDATRIEQYILNNCSDNEEINAIYAEIINAPTIEAEPIQHGHWIMKPNGHGTCSNCHRCSLDILGGVGETSMDAEANNDLCRMIADFLVGNIGNEDTADGTWSVMVLDEEGKPEAEKLIRREPLN